MTKVLVIAGWERSGSTILANVLGSAPGVVTIGEINNIWERGFARDLLCACGEPFSRCESWRPIAERAFGSDFDWVSDAAASAMRRMGNTWLITRRLPFYGGHDRGRGDEYARLLDPLYHAAARHTGAALLVDASKSPWHAAVAYDLEGLDVHVLHLVRDPRGVAYSLGKDVRYDTDDERSILMDKHGAGKSSAAWVYRTRLIESTWRHKPRVSFLRYEDFVAAPRTTIRSLLDRVGVDTAPVFHDEHEVTMELSHNVSGNPVRFQYGSVRLRADEVWREQLPPAKRRSVELVTWPLMAKLGYH